MTCGRVAGRIGGASFTIDGKEFPLEANNGTACLHGGSKGFDQQVWDQELIDMEPVKLSQFVDLSDGTQEDIDLYGVKFTRVSADMEQGFPVELKVSSWYLMGENGELLMVWDAEAVGDDPSRKTPVNICNHAYWNLSGDFKDKTVRDHMLKLGCSTMLPMGEGSIPTGDIEKVQGTPFDFTGEASKIGDQNRLDGAIDGGGKNGIDHCFIIDGAEANDNKLRFAAELSSATSGLKMTVSTTQRACVVYTANYVGDEDPESRHQQHAAVCLETCMLNNAVNNLGKQGWPDENQVLLSPGQKYRHAALHKFNTMS